MLLGQMKLGPCSLTSQRITPRLTSIGNEITTLAIEKNDS